MKAHNRKMAQVLAFFIRINPFFATGATGFELHGFSVARFECNLGAFAINRE